MDRAALNELTKGELIELVLAQETRHAAEMAGLRERIAAWFRICHFWVTRTCKERRPVRAGFRQAMCPVWEAASLPRSSPLGLKRSQAQQGEPVWMALAGHQLPRAFALALGVPAAQEAAVVQEEPQQVQV
jgi:hypothetical protein